jgi:hypothetical protein
LKGDRGIRQIAGERLSANVVNDAPSDGIGRSPGIALKGHDRENTRVPQVGYDLKQL